VCQGESDPCVLTAVDWLCALLWLMAMDADKLNVDSIIQRLLEGLLFINFLHQYIAWYITGWMKAFQWLEVG